MNQNILDQLQTKEGANAFLRHIESKSDGCFDFFSSELKTVEVLRKREKRKKKLNLAVTKELFCTYFVIYILAKHSGLDVFREIVPEQEIAAWFDHVADILQQKINDPHWIRTGTLLEHDEILFSSYYALVRHPLPAVMTFENTNILEIITSMIISRKGATNKLPGQHFVHGSSSLVYDLYCCGSIHFDNPWEPERVFKKLNATGILEQFLRCTTVPSAEVMVPNEAKTMMFRKLLRCTKFVKKRRKEGTPCGDTLREIVQERDGPAAICHHALPFFQTMVKLSTMLQIKDDTDDEVDCQHCKKISPRNKYWHCGRCKRVNYCSRKCQKAHWKEHKKVCYEANYPTKLSRAAIQQILEGAYVDIMVRLVEYCDEASELTMKDMVLEVDLCPDECGRIPLLQDPPQFDIVPIARYHDRTRPRELWSAEGLEEVDVNSNVERMVAELTEKQSCLGYESHLLCSEQHPTEWVFNFHQLFTKDQNKPMFTEEALDAFRTAVVKDDYSRLSAIFENQEVLEIYEDQIRRLQSGGA